MPGQNVGLSTCLHLAARVDQEWLQGGVTRQGTPFVQAGKIVGVDGGPRLDLDRQQPLALVQEDVDLVAGAVPPKIEVRRQAGVEKVKLGGLGETFAQVAPAWRVIISIG